MSPTNRLNAVQRQHLDQALAWLRGCVAPTADLRLDSREIEPGDVFVACPGLVSDGRQFMDQALARGASAILSETESTPVGAEGE